MTSSKTQLPFEYYSLNFCKPPKVEYQAIFQILRSYWLKLHIIRGIFENQKVRKFG